jgi:hypothetical protein
VYHTGSLDKRAILRRIVGDELVSLTNLTYSITFDFLDEDGGGYNWLDTVVTSTPEAERVGIELVYNISSSITVSKARCIDSASLVIGTGKTLFGWYIGAVYCVADRSANTVGSAGVIGRSAEVQEESAIVLHHVRRREENQARINMPSD